MQKTVLKTLGIFTLLFFVMSMTGAAACTSSACTACTGPTCAACKTVAKGDTFNFSPCSKCGNVLKNDKGCGLKVVKTGSIPTVKGGTVQMKSNGSFCYKPASCSATVIHDSFVYTIKNKYGKTSTATVKINYKCRC
jgi:hypothetical protein